MQYGCRRGTRRTGSGAGCAAGACLLPIKVAGRACLVAAVLAVFTAAAAAWADPPRSTALHPTPRPAGVPARLGLPFDFVTPERCERDRPPRSGDLPAGGGRGSRGGHGRLGGRRQRPTLGAEPGCDCPIAAGAVTVLEPQQVRSEPAVVLAREAGRSATRVMLVCRPIGPATATGIRFRGMEFFRLMAQASLCKHRCRNSGTNRSSMRSPGRSFRLRALIGMEQRASAETAGISVPTVRVWRRATAPCAAPGVAGPRS